MRTRRHRDFGHLKRTGVRNFYALNHADQTVASVERKQREFLRRELQW
jgi:hypothetical protein